MTENERLKEYFEFKRFKQREIADMLSTTRAYIGNILAGDALSMNLIKKITEKFPDLNTDWLLTGRGEMLIKEEAKPDIMQRILDELAEMNNRVKDLEVLNNTKPKATKQTTLLKG